MEKSRLTLILKILLIIAILFLIGVIGYDYYQKIKTQDVVNNILQQLDNQILINADKFENGENIINEQEKKPIEKTVTINNYKIYGKIYIPSVGIKYPILEYNAEVLKNNICNLSTKSINGKGNLCIAGHNTSNGTLFGKLKKVKCGDIVEVTNIYGNKYKYLIYSITIVDPTDNSVLIPTEKPILTLITCTNSAKQRLIVRGQLLSDN